MKTILAFIICISASPVFAGVGLVEFSSDGAVVFEGVRSVKTVGLPQVTSSIALEAGSWLVEGKNFEVVAGEVVRLGKLSGKDGSPSHNIKQNLKTGRIRVVAAEKAMWRLSGESAWRKSLGETSLPPGAYRLEWQENEAVQGRPLAVDAEQLVCIALPQVSEVFVETNAENNLLTGPKRKGSPLIGDVAVLLNDQSAVVAWQLLQKPHEVVGQQDVLLGVSKEAPYQNSLGMAFVPAGTPGVLFSVWETRVKDFESFVEDSGHDAISNNAFGEPAFTLESGPGWKQVGGSWRDPRYPAKQTGEHPVVCVSYLDAEAFCAWLTKKDRASGKIPTTASYRLPSDSEWSRACGGSDYPWGDSYPPKESDGNYAGAEAMVGALRGMRSELSKAGFRDGAARTSPVGMFKENRFGLYDMGGNVFEWCSTWYTADLNDAETLKEVPILKDDKGGQTYRVLRGASWRHNVRVELCSSARDYDPPLYRGVDGGFRCVLVVAGR